MTVTGLTKDDDTGVNHDENHNFAPSDEIPENSFYEAGLIAQDLIEIDELSFSVKQPEDKAIPLSV